MYSVHIVHCTVCVSAAISSMFTRVKGKYFKFCKCNTTCSIAGSIHHLKARHKIDHFRRTFFLNYVPPSLIFSDAKNNVFFFILCCFFNAANSATHSVFLTPPLELLFVYQMISLKNYVSLIRKSAARLGMSVADASYSKHKYSQEH